MRKKMREANLSPPLFESSRTQDLFVSTFLFHHFLSDEDINWLANFKQFHLSDEQARALIFVREVGAINNSAYRNLNEVDTLTASTALRKMKDNNLLASKNQGVATYYTPGRQLIDSMNKAQNTTGKEQVLDGKRHQLDGKRHQLENENTGHQPLPKSLQATMEKLGKKAPQEEVRKAILALCQFKEMTAAELANYLQRHDKRRLVRSFLTPMLEEKLLEYKYPQMPGHPNQKYKAKKK